LLRGMVLGQDEAIDDVARADFRASGLAHLLAVSGQNVMLLAALALPLLLFSGVGPRAGLVVVCALIAVYVPLAGAGPSLQRAGVMGLAGLVAMAASRPASRWYALLLAAVATLAWNPRSAGEPGWQLSFAAVVGILVLGVPMGRWLGHAAIELVRGAGPAGPGERSTRAVRILADGVAMTVAATLTTAPLLAHHFGSVPLAGLPANVLALPAVAPAMWLGMVKIALGQLGGLPGAPGELAAAAAAALGRPAAVAVGYLAWLAERFADAPGGQVALRLPSAPAVIAAYAGMAAAASAIRWAARPLAARLDELAAHWRRLPRARRAGMAAVLVLVALGAGAETLSRPSAPEALTVRFLDVGQGDATLIQHPDGTAVLFDGGPPEAGVTRLLRRAGVSRLALVVATHASRDHHGGLRPVLGSFPVDVLLDGGDGTGDPEFRELLREAAGRGVKHVRAVAPLTLGLAGGDLTVTVVSPPPRPPGPPPEDPNPRAVVALVRSGGFDLLLSADAESEALLPLALPDVDALKVPHHGSADPGLPEALERLRPEVGAIEVGPNSYGHPAPSTLAALDRAGVRAYRTDRDGSVTLTVEGGRMTVSTER
ncbi:MAG TPA: ComEC/Rec2 family competence protein, partial [Thermoleophilaceae bacterium]|nr:ComEC/Rec2 family competence protein [Thermoleophilaceae bacterium]